MDLRIERPGSTDGDKQDGLSYLSYRVRQEAAAAINASSVEATTIHVILATAYAKRFGEGSARAASLNAERWVAQHRLW
jgi:hypothetical protein